METGNKKVSKVNSKGRGIELSCLSRSGVGPHAPLALLVALHWSAAIRKDLPISNQVDREVNLSVLIPESMMSGSMKGERLAVCHDRSPLQDDGIGVRVRGNSNLDTKQGNRRPVAVFKQHRANGSKLESIRYAQPDDYCCRNRFVVEPSEGTLFFGTSCDGREHVPTRERRVSMASQKVNGFPERFGTLGKFAMGKWPLMNLKEKRT